MLAFLAQEIFFQLKISDIYPMFVSHKDRGYSLEPHRLGGSIEYPHYLFIQNKKRNVLPCKPQVLLFQMGFSGYSIN